MLALLLTPGPADASVGGTTLEASLKFSSQQQGEIRLELAWSGGPYPPEGMDWAGLREQYLDTNFSLSGEPNAEAVLRYLTPRALSDSEAPARVRCARPGAAT